MASSLRSVESRRVGRYLLYDQLAAGGMAAVHVGRLLGPVGFTRTVAIKRLHAHYANDPDFVAMFVDEARLASRVRHPNVVATLDVVAEKDNLLVVMEYVHGESLSRLRKNVEASGGSIPVRIALAIMSGVLYGLHAAHEATSDGGKPLGIVHRDVSPQNVVVGMDGVARVLDFGIAKAAMRLQTTRDGYLKGKAAYMAPEQCRFGATVDRRADVYAASVVLWEALTGRRLFEGDNPLQIMNEVHEREVAPPSSIVADVPSDLDAIVLRGLSRAPDDRFATARDMAVALESVLPLVAAREVGEWVEKVASTAIEQRTALIARIEEETSGDTDARGRVAAPSSGAPGAPRVSEVPTEKLADAASARTAHDQEGTAGVQSLVVDARRDEPMTLGRYKRRSLVPVVAIGIVVVAAVGVVWMRNASRDDAATRKGVPVAATSSDPRPVPSVVSAMQTGDVPPTVSASASVLAAAATPPSASTKPRAIPTGSAPLVVPAKRPPNCNPDFWIDERGIKRFKPECVQ